MLVRLLLFIFHTQANCDWVEISQQHYLKPARATRVIPQMSVSVIKDVERTTQANKVYLNNSLAYPSWNQGAVYKVHKSEVRKNINSEVLRSKPLNFEKEKSDIDVRKMFIGPTKPTKEVFKRPAEESKRYTGHVYFNKDNVRRITFTSAEEPLKALEVLNLSDLHYDVDEISTIEVNDETIGAEQFEHMKHLAAVISTEDNTEQTEEILPNTVQSQSKNNNRKSFSTKAASQKDIKVTEKNPNPKDQGLNMATKNLLKSNKKDKDDNFDLKNDKELKSNKATKVEILDEKLYQNLSSARSEQIKQEIPKYVRNNFSESQQITQRNKIVKNNKSDSNHLNPIQGLESEKLIQGKPMIEKNVLRIDELPKPSNIRNPEEVMLEEILHESNENIKDNNHKIPSSGTIIKVSNKSMIAKVDPKTTNENRKQTSFKPVESQIQRSSVKPLSAVESRKTDGYDTKYVTIKSINTVTASSEESEELECVQLNSPIQPPVNADENLFKSTESNNHAHEDITGTTKNDKNDQNYEQENQNVLVLTPIGNQKETRTKVKSSLSETSTNVKIELTTKASPEEQIDKTSDEKRDSEKIDSKKPPAEKKNNQENGTEETLVNDTTADTLGTLVKVLKLVTETISRNTKKTLRGKMRYLEELRDTIMASIEQRLEAAFPDDDAAPRRARSAHTHPRGHVEFPSSESALMTISFLTFAVFLIKLVLQVIQAYKHKAMVMPAVVATVGRAYNHYSKVNED